MSDENAPAGGGTPGLDIEAIGRLLDEKLNRAIGSRLSRNTLDKLIGEKLEAALGGEGISKAVEAAIVKMVEATPAEPSPSTGTTSQQGNAAPPVAQAAPDPKVGELEKQLKAMQKQLAAEQSAARAAAEAAKVARINGQLEAALMPHVGNSARMAKLIAKELAATVDEPAPGTLAWKRGDDEPVAFADGFKAWLGSPEAKELLPAQQRNIPPANFLGTPSGYTERASAPGRQPNPLLDEMRRGINQYAPDPTGNAPSSK